MAGTGYLDKLNDNQRAAVEFGVGGESLSPPLLVIAGAGSGKINTLTHRVEHLLVNATDPRRILRKHALSIGLHPEFSTHDREDSADLMNLSQPSLGFSKTESRFPAKATCLSIYSRAVEAETPLGMSCAIISLGVHRGRPN